MCVCVRARARARARVIQRTSICSATFAPLSILASEVLVFCNHSSLLYSKLGSDTHIILFFFVLVVCKLCNRNLAPLFVFLDVLFLFFHLYMHYNLFVFRELSAP